MATGLRSLTVPDSRRRHWVSNMARRVLLRFMGTALLPANLKPEESKRWEAGIDGLTGPLDWRISAYHYEIQNLIDYKTINIST